MGPQVDSVTTATPCVTPRALLNPLRLVKRPTLPTLIRVTCTPGCSRGTDGGGLAGGREGEPSAAQGLASLVHERAGERVLTELHGLCFHLLDPP